MQALVESRLADVSHAADAEGDIETLHKASAAKDGMAGFDDLR